MLSLSSGIRGIRRIAPLAVAALAVLAAVPAWAASGSAASGDAGSGSAGLFTCYADPLRVNAMGQLPPNPYQPCRNDQIGGARSTGSAGSVRVTATGVAGTTSVSTGAGTAQAAATGAATTENGSATASAASARLIVGRNVIELVRLSSSASITCTHGANGARFSFQSTSSVGTVKINGRPVAVGTGATTIKVGTGTLTLNHTSTTATAITQHAAMLHTPKAQVVLGEVVVGIADTAHNPCHP